MGSITWLSLCIPLSGFFWTMELPMVWRIALVAAQTAPVLEHTVSLLTKPQPPIPIQNPQSPFPTFNSPQLDRQIQLYQRYVATVGRPDILIVGSSRALWGVDPVVLQQTLAERGYPHLRVFNFSVNGATAQVVDLVLRQILPPEQLPQLIIWADGVRAFNSGRPDQTYKNILMSQGYKLLQTGAKPIPSQLEMAQTEQFCIEIPANYLARLPIPSTGTADISAPQFNPRLLCTQGFGWVNALQFSAQAQSDIHAPFGLSAIAQAQAAGFLPLSAKFNPDSYFQHYPRVPGDFDADYQSFRLEGEQRIATENLLKFTELHRIPIVFVSLPLTQTYLDPVRSWHEQQFRAYMKGFASAKQLLFYDLSERWPTQHDYFVDPGHLNQFGAAAVAKALGRDLLIPPELAAAIADRNQR